MASAWTSSSIAWRSLRTRRRFPQLLKTIVLLVDENLRLKVMLKQPLPEKCGCTCEHPDLILDGGMPCKIRTRFVSANEARVRILCTVWVIIGGFVHAGF